MSDERPEPVPASAEVIDHACLRIVFAAIAYVEGTYPDDHPLAVELRTAVGLLREADPEAG